MVSKFGSAFSSARKAGKKEFDFGGKKFNTKLKEDTKKSDVKLPKSGPIPSARPEDKKPESKTASAAAKNAGGGQFKKMVEGMSPKKSSPVVGSGAISGTGGVSGKGKTVVGSGAIVGKKKK